MDLNLIFGKAAQTIATQIDSELGYKIDQIENNLDPLLYIKHLAWIGLNPSLLQTPHFEMKHILEQLNLLPGELIVDLGAGYGRMAFVIDEYFKELHWIGFELVPERVAEGKRVMDLHQLDSRRLILADVSAEKFELPKAQAFFIYDFGSDEAILQCLNKLKNLTPSKSTQLAARGKRVQDLIKKHYPWLIESYPPKIFKNYTIYRF